MALGRKPKDEAASAPARAPAASTAAPPAGKPRDREARVARMIEKAKLRRERREKRGASPRLLKEYEDAHAEKG